MEPEKGDPSVRVTRDDVARAVAAVGVVPGDTVIFHSSLSSLGTVVGGPDAVIDGFLDAVGPTGTVAVPTLCNWAPGEQELVFDRWDPATTPSYVGRLTETLRRRPEAVRSDHATHSVAAIGAGATALCADHGAAGRRPGPFGDQAFAVASPWQRLYDGDAAYLFVGVTLRVCTMVHFVESLLVERALARVRPDRRAALAAEVQGWLTPGVWPSFRVPDREVFESELEAAGGEQRGQCGSATIRCVRARRLVDDWLVWAERDPDLWLPEAYQAWLARGA